jgi:hypothetical protein
VKLEGVRRDRVGHELIGLIGLIAGGDVPPDLEPVGVRGSAAGTTAESLRALLVSPRLDGVPLAATTAEIGGRR